MSSCSACGLAAEADICVIHGQSNGMDVNNNADRRLSVDEKGINMIIAVVVAIWKDVICDL